MSAKRIDANQPKIVKDLRAMGYTVQSLADVGDGTPDIVVGKNQQNWLFEIKDWKQPPSKRRLTPKEKLWHQLWRGQVCVIETVDDALKAMNGGGK